MTAPRFTDDELAAVATGTRLRLPAPFFGAVDVYVRPLSHPELSDARRDAKAHARFRLAQRGMGTEALEVAHELLERTFQRCVVLRATMCPGSGEAPFFASLAEVEALDASTVITLFHTFAMAQTSVEPVADEDDAKALAKALGANVDPLARARAQHATALCAYYDVRSVRQLTDWQVIAFLKAMETSQ